MKMNLQFNRKPFQYEEKGFELKLPCSFLPEDHHRSSTKTMAFLPLTFTLRRVAHWNCQVSFLKILCAQTPISNLIFLVYPLHLTFLELLR